MVSPWTLYGMFRIKGDPNMVQVQFGPFSRPLPEREYLARRLEPPMEKLPWKGERNDHFGDRAQIASTH
jgi:hypothetical protein